MGFPEGSFRSEIANLTLPEMLNVSWKDKIVYTGVNFRHVVHANF